jgi:sulfur carrier protein ThiS
MKVIVKLFGTLGQHLPGYNHEWGMDVLIRDGATVKDLLAHLEVRGPKGLIVAAEGRLLKPEDELESGGSVQIFQSVFGG